ncbi:hypothetical protein [Streptomyces sp. NPDC001292]|uniref:hypothetical protein n=1 Tax=Streptomyces sp. NPDC001292 TaxID=3364558 RepID=UPI003680B8B7
MALRGGRTAPWLIWVLPVVAVGVGVLLCGVPAVAVTSDGGGAPRAPDVALVVAGGSGRTRALHLGDRDFTRLRELLRPAYTGTEPVPEAWARGRHPAVRVTVVWGLTGVGGWPVTSRPPGGDVAVERQDQLIVAEDGTPWVRSDLAPDVEDDDIRWHRAPRDLYERLARTGLLGDVESAPSGRTPGAAGDHLWWAAGGLAAGAGGTLLICRAAARRGTGPPREERRQELIDL